MGFFGRKNKSATNTPNTDLDRTPRAPAAPHLLVVPPTPTQAIRPTLRLRVALHPAPAGLSSAEELFWVEVDPDDDMNDLRRAVTRKVNGATIGLFKVELPEDAFEQAAEYSRRYTERVDLVSHFPAWSIDDIQQWRQSLGPSGWKVQVPPYLRVRDWWPFPNSDPTMISIIARPAPPCSSMRRPLTLLAHFALPTDHASTSASPALSRTPSSPSVKKQHRRPPTPVDILPSSTIGQLKAALLAADGRPVDKLDKVVLWRVEMSEEEMVVIEQRGGLKSGQMPWPYPPTAEVPTALSNDSLTVDYYFPNSHSNARLVSLSVWIHPSASDTLARAIPAASLNAPSFRYPMVFPPPEVRRASESHSLPASSPPLDVEVAITAETLPARVSGRSRRARPSTAPAACDSAPQSAFGAGLRSIRNKSPLSHTPTHDPQVKGLGIAGSEMPEISAQPTVNELGVDMTRLSLKVDMGDSTAAMSTIAESEGAGKIVWQPAAGSLSRRETKSTGIRSVAHNRSLRAYEIY